MDDSKAGMTDHYEWINHKGKTILCVRFHHDQKDGASAKEKFVHEISDHENGSIRLLADLNHAGFWPEQAFEWQKHQGLINSKCLKLAAVGARGGISAAARTFLAVAQAMGLAIGDKTRFFESHDLAKDWLAE